MQIAFYMDHNIHGQIVIQLRRRGIDVLTAEEDGQKATDDELLLARATELDRVFVTFDKDFLEIGNTWIVAGREFSGIVFKYGISSQLRRMIDDLELIAKASTIDEWRNYITVIPL